MTRLSAQRNVVTPEEKVGFHDALRMYTLGGAVAVHEEDSKGSIAPGKLADLVVLGADPGKVEPDQVDQVPVEMVFVGGLQVAGG
jgi:predicted amidohydrolase YtcJ